MSLRELMEKNKQASTIAAVALVVGAVSLVVYQMLPERPSKYEWYSNDDGATWFKDSLRRVPPFDKDGKPAVLVKVYECKGKQFVAWMERYKPEAQKKVLAFRAREDKGENPDPIELVGVFGQTEHKKPGGKEWTGDLAAFTGMSIVKCPDGSNEEPTIVYP